MHQLIRISFVVFLAASLMATADIQPSFAQDLAAVNPTDVKVLVDNDKVRVLEVLHKPGAKEPTHSHPAYVAVFLSGTRLKTTFPDGKTAEKDRKAGEAFFSEPVTHAVENIGTADQHVIVIELKK